jgi:hypothetical protein
MTRFDSILPLINEVISVELAPSVKSVANKSSFSLDLILAKHSIGFYLISFSLYFLSLRFRYDLIVFRVLFP